MKDIAYDSSTILLTCTNEVKEWFNNSLSFRRSCETSGNIDLPICAVLANSNLKGVPFLTVVSIAKLILKYELYRLTLTIDESEQMSISPRLYEPPLCHRQYHTTKFIETPSDCLQNIF
jgi:hypothetical protein